MKQVEVESQLIKNMEKDIDERWQNQERTISAANEIMRRYQNR